MLARKFILLSVCIGSVVCHGQAPQKKREKKQPQQRTYSALQYIRSIDNSLQDPDTFRKWTDEAKNALWPLAYSENTVEKSNDIFKFISSVASVIKNAQYEKTLKQIMSDSGLGSVLQDVVKKKLDNYAYFKSVNNMFNNLHLIIHDFDAELVKKWDQVYLQLLKDTPSKQIFAVNLVRHVYLRSQVRQSLPIPWRDIWCKKAEGSIDQFDPLGLANSVHGLGKLEVTKTEAVKSFIEAWCDTASYRLDNFKAVDLSNSIYGLGKLEAEKTPTVSSFIKAWCNTAHEKLGSFTEFQLVNNIYGLGKLEAEKTPTVKSFIDAWCDTAYEKLGSFTTLQLANSIYGLGKLEAEKTPAVKSFIDAWCDTAYEKLGSFTTLQLANSIYGLGKLEAEKTQAVKSFIDAWCDTAWRRLISFTALGLANSIYGLGKLEAEKTPTVRSFIEAWCNAAYEKLGSFTVLQLANIIYGPGKLEAEKTPAVSSFIEGWCNTARGRLNSFTELQLANSIYGLGKLEAEKTRAVRLLVEDWCDKAWRKLNSFTALQFANSIYGLGKLEVEKTDAVASFIRAWLGNAHQQLYNFTLQQLANSAYALSKLPVKALEGYQAWIEKWYIAARSTLSSENFYAQNLAYSVFALANLRDTKTPAFWQFMQTWCEQAHSTLEQCTLHDLSLLVCGVGGLGLSVSDESLSPELFDTLLSIISQRVQIHTQIDNPRMLYGLALLHINHENNYEYAQYISSIAHAVIGRIRIHSDMSKEDVTKLAWSLRYLDSPRLDELMQVMQEALNFGDDDSASDFERSVYDVISSLYSNDKIPESPHGSFKIHELFTSVDIGFPHHKALVEVDGPTHFFGDSRERVPSDKLKNKLLKKLGWSVVRIPYFELNKWQTNEEKQTYLLGKLHLYFHLQ